MSNDSSIRAAVACVDTKHFTHHLFDHWLEGPILGQVQAVEGQLSRVAASVQWASIVALWCRYLVLFQRLLPELMRDERLCFADRCEMRVVPMECAVAFEFRPVAL